MARTPRTPQFQCWRFAREPRRAQSVRLFRNALAPRQKPGNIEIRDAGGSGLATSLGRMCVYFANTGYQFQPSFGAINGAAPETPPGPWLGPSPWPRKPPQRQRHPGPARPRMPRRRLPRGRFPRPRGGAQRRKLPRRRFPWPRAGVQPWPKG